MVRTDVYCSLAKATKVSVKIVFVLLGCQNGRLYEHFNIKILTY